MVFERPQELKLPLDQNNDSVKLNWATSEVQKEILDVLKGIRKGDKGTSPEAQKKKRADDESLRKQQQNTKTTDENIKKSNIFRKGLDKAKNSLGLFSKKTDKSSENIEKFTDKFGRRVENFSENVRGMGTSMESASSSILRIVGATGTLGVLFGAAVSTLESLNRVQISLVKTGFDLQGEMKNVRNQLANIGIGYEEFGNLISEQGTHIRYLGFNALDASKNFIGLVEKTYDITERFGNFGLTTEELANEMASMTEHLVLQGWSREQIMKDSVTQFTFLNEEVLRYANLTGKNRRELLRDRMERAKDQSTEAALLKYTLEKIGKGAETAFDTTLVAIRASFGPASDAVVALTESSVKALSIGERAYTDEQRRLMTMTGTTHIFRQFGEDLKNFKNDPEKMRETVKKFIDGVGNMTHALTDEQKEALFRASKQNSELGELARFLTETNRQWRITADNRAKLEAEEIKIKEKYAKAIDLLGDDNESEIERNRLAADRARELHEARNKTLSTGAKQAVNLQNEIAKMVHLIKSTFLTFLGIESGDFENADPAAFAESINENIKKLRGLISNIRKVVTGGITGIGDFTKSLGEATKRAAEFLNFDPDTSNSIGKTVESIADIAIGAFTVAFISKRFRNFIWDRIKGSFKFARSIFKLTTKGGLLALVPQANISTAAAAPGPTPAKPTPMPGGPVGPRGETANYDNKTQRFRDPKTGQFRKTPSTTKPAGKGSPQGGSKKGSSSMVKNLAKAGKLILKAAGPASLGFSAFMGTQNQEYEDLSTNAQIVSGLTGDIMDTYNFLIGSGEGTLRSWFSDADEKESGIAGSSEGINKFKQKILNHIRKIDDQSTTQRKKSADYKWKDERKYKWMDNKGLAPLPKSMKEPLSKSMKEPLSSSEIDKFLEEIEMKMNDRKQQEQAFEMRSSFDINDKSFINKIDELIKEIRYQHDRHMQKWNDLNISA